MNDLIVIIAVSMAGGMVYHWRGHASPAKKYFPRPFNQMLFALPYAVLCLPPATSHWGIPAVVLVLTTLGVLTGHGRFMDLGSWGPPAKPETLEFIIRPLDRVLPGYWYDALGLAVTGLAVTLPAGIALGHPALALSGALKAPAYMLARAMARDKAHATESGEIFTGVWLWSIVAITAIGGVS